MTQHVAMRWAINTVADQSKGVAEVFNKIGATLFIVAEGGSDVLEFIHQRVLEDDGDNNFMRESDTQLQRMWINVFNCHYSTAEMIVDSLLSVEVGADVLDINAILIGIALSPLPEGINLEEGENPDIFDIDDPSLSDEIRDELQLNRAFNLLIDTSISSEIPAGTSTTLFVKSAAERLRAIAIDSAEMPAFDSIWQEKAMELAVQCVCISSIIEPSHVDT